MQRSIADVEGAAPVDVFDQGITAVAQQAEHFESIGRWVEKIELTRLDLEQRLEFAAQAMALW